MKACLKNHDQANQARKCCGHSRARAEQVKTGGLNPRRGASR
jgi:hypothetical protein